MRQIRVTKLFGVLVHEPQADDRRVRGRASLTCAVRARKLANGSARRPAESLDATTLWVGAGASKPQEDKLAFKLKRKINPVRYEFEGSAEDIAGCKQGDYLDTENGDKVCVMSVDPEELTIIVSPTVRTPFTMPSGLGRKP